MTFDADVVQSRLGLMHELLYFLDQTGDITGESLAQDIVTRLAVERILTQLVELAVAINSHMAMAIRATPPTSYRESFTAAAKAAVIPSDLARELAPSAGLRNVLIHRYVEIDFDIVAASVLLAKDGYRRYITQVARFLLAHQ